MLLFALAIFLSAFLLFQVQPLIAKIILPWFGGSSTVWSTCMLFFQAVLLLGYLYAHWLHEKLSARKQAIVHSVALMAGLAALPIMPAASWRGAGLENPSWQILKLLAVAVGLPYFLLSTTTPLLQVWYARTHARAMPYRLFALSNLAAMLALVTYPVVFEPNLSVRHQANLWMGAYLCFTLLCSAAAWRGLKGAGTAAGAAASAVEDSARAPGWGVRLLWVALAACASILFLSTTTYLTQDVAAIPFLWILPLSIYLLSFIICFEAPRLYWRPVFIPLLIAALGAMYYALYQRASAFKVIPAIALGGGALFVFCMFCHGELARAKPAPRHLTIFYVMVSAGGALGGLLVGIIAPNFFNAPYEFPAGLFLCACLVLAVLTREKLRFLLTGRGRVVGVVASALLCVYGLALVRGVREWVSHCRVVERNFYGQLRVYDIDNGDGLGARRKLLHGLINHGEQVLSEEYRRRPATYYCPGTGVGDVLSNGQGGAPRRIGILGLGSGTLAAYGRAGDVFRIYEINPLILKLARTEFTYLEDTPARIETVLGDGRLALESEPSQNFDVLIMDAFSGDSVPVHLITKEAVGTYLRHLKPDGILAVNVSNRYLDLRPVMERAASYFGKAALLFDFRPDDKDPVCFSALWVLVMDQKTRVAMPGALGAGKVLESRPGFRMWTDDYSNMFGILK